MLDTLVAAVSGKAGDSGAVIEAVAQTLADRTVDPAFVAEAVLLPSEAFIGDQMVTVDPDAIRRERQALQAAIGAALQTEWRVVPAGDAPPAQKLSPGAKGTDPKSGGWGEGESVRVDPGCRRYIKK